MNYIYSFIFCGFVCAISQIVLEKTKFTPGHMNTILVIVGCLLSGFHIYDKILGTFHTGASILIVNFGHLLVKGASEGFLESGVIGLFKGVLVSAGAGISLSVTFALIVALLFKVRD